VFLFLIWRKTTRFLISASWALLLVLPAVIGATIAILTKAQNGALTVPTWVTVTAIFAAGLLLLQAYAEYRRRTYDMTWAFKFDDQFNSDSMKKLRAKAALCLEQNISDLGKTDPCLSDIDDVLDFFDELGFCERAGQMSPEVLHQNFHYWIKGYCSAAHHYIAAWRLKDPPRWEYVERLNKIVHAVAQRRKHKASLYLNMEDVRRFLDEEKGLIEDH